MPKLIKRDADGQFAAAEDAFIDIREEDGVPAAIPGNGPVILSLARFQEEGDALLSGGRQVGVRIASNEAIEDLAYDLPRLALVALEFPKYRDGRAYTSARLLRERFGYTGEIRAVGDVLREGGALWAGGGSAASGFPAGWRRGEGPAAPPRSRLASKGAADSRAPAWKERA